ncbi:hypothetical protein HMP0721_1710 [Pseudoramibacter alactolyticus ATCC 23263]|uniref:Uncharacterized protein n=1 Tax=Pseudoramibacter alactolyticus ATCC 23263 TaxID=887929 RepID=E6MI05_9FIRM|nr:hypothetical protein HMP0721_1710 [Pseudoramibacter alactolyticus ATCC 23263]
MTLGENAGLKEAMVKGAEGMARWPFKCSLCELGAWLPLIAR